MMCHFFRLYPLRQKAVSIIIDDKRLFARRFFDMRVRIDVQKNVTKTQVEWFHVLGSRLKTHKQRHQRIPASFQRHCCFTHLVILTIPGFEE